MNTPFVLWTFPPKRGQKHKPRKGLNGLIQPSGLIGLYNVTDLTALSVLEA